MQKCEENASLFPGGIGLCWSFIWMLIVHPTPEDHPTISKEEKEYILQETGKNLNTVNIPAGRKTFFREC